MTSDTLSLLIDVSKLFIPLIAIAGIWIAMQQYAVNRDKIRFTLYDKRFKIYDIIMNHLYDMYESEDTSFEEHNKFMTACNEAQFLLPNKIYSQVNTTKDLIIKIRLIRRSINRRQKAQNVDQEKLDELHTELFEQEDLLTNLEPKITEAFHSVLNFERF